MINFKNLVSKKREVDYTDLLKLFESLDRQTSHIDLRPTQIEAISKLSFIRNQKDIVLKISTGMGKTAIALLFLLSHMEEKKRPVVYLCPTIQLVHQVKEEAIRLGINTVIYPAGEPHPAIDGVRAEAIIICTYAKLFNAKTTFDRPDVMLRPCALVLDDAHAGVEEIRDSFTLRISESDLFAQIINLLDSSCSHYKAGLWDSIKKRDPLSSLEVPFWIWKSVSKEVREAISNNADNKNFIFVWPYLRDMLRWCRCIISGIGLEIIPEVLPVNIIGA
jgi:Rad3-related DNA helicase